MPDFTELLSIVDQNRLPSINIAFQSIASGYADYWSSNTDGTDLDFALAYRFAVGHSISGYKDGGSSYLNARCVRTGQISTSSSSFSSVASSSNSSISCPTGFVFSNGMCVITSSSSLSSFSSSSSSAQTPPSLPTTKTLTLQSGWNLISVPIQTDTEFNLNLLLTGKATIAYKFKTDSNSWEKWLPGTATATLKNGEGVFVGVPSSNGSPSVAFEAVSSANGVRFEDTVYAVNKWYLLGFGYDMSVSAIKALYVDSVIFIMENGSYKRLDNTATVIPAGQGFWFKTKSAKIVTSSSSSSVTSPSSASSSSSSSSVNISGAYYGSAYLTSGNDPECEEVSTGVMNVQTNGSITGSLDTGLIIDGLVITQNTLSGTTDDGTVWSGTLTNTTISGTYDWRDRGYYCRGTFSVTKR